MTCKSIKTWSSGGLSAWLVCVFAAVWLTMLLHGGGTARWDLALFAFLRPVDKGWVSEWAYFVTWLGDWLVLVPLTITAAGYLLWLGRRLEISILLITTAAVRALVEVQKALIGRPRPDVEHLMIEHSASFPSAHAANALATYLAIALFVPRSWYLKRVLVCFALIGCALVGWSRVVLGVHWPSDIIGGWALTMLTLLIVCTLSGSRLPTELKVEEDQRCSD